MFLTVDVLEVDVLVVDALELDVFLFPIHTSSQKIKIEIKPTRLKYNRLVLLVYLRKVYLY
jgi:hypothetical protein